MAYAFYRTCTVDHTQCGASDSTNFPVLVSFSDGTMRDVAHGGHLNNSTTSNGQTVPADLAFYNDSGLTTLLNFEVEFWDNVNGILIAWVQIGTLSHTSDTSFYMAYDDASVTTFQGNVHGTWDGTFAAVYHLPNSSTLSGNDSTANANNASPNNAGATTGQIDGAAVVVDDLSLGQALTIADAASMSPSSALTVSGWLKTSSSQTQDGAVLSKWNTGTTGWMLYISAGGQVFGFIGGTSAAGATLSPSTVYFLAAIWTGSSLQVYVNAAASGSAASVGSISTDTGVAEILSYNGRENNASHVPQLGVGAWVDEARLANVARSADWITAEYNNQKTSSTFLTVGSETPVGGGDILLGQAVL